MKRLLMALTLVVMIFTGCASKKGNNSGYTVLMQETNGGMEEETNLLINSQKELVLLYKQVNKQLVPRVDFKKNSVVAIFMGQKSSGGYSISITDVSIVEKMAEITVSKTSPTGMVTMALTAPYCIAVIPKVDEIKVK